MSEKSYWATVPQHERVRVVAEDGRTLAYLTAGTTTLGSPVTLRYPESFRVESASADWTTFTPITPTARGVVEEKP